MSAGKDPMLRGSPAPAGFASSVSGWIQQFVAQTRLSNGGAGIGMLARLNTVDGCSSAAVAAGDDDPRIRTLALASPGPRWNPGQQQLAALQGAGHKAGSIAGVSGEPDDLLTGDRLLNALAHGAMLDMHAARERELSKLRKQPDLPLTASAVLVEAEQARDRAERLVRERDATIEQISGDYVALKASHRNLQRILSSTGAIDKVVGDPAARDKVPGVRERGKGRFEAILYRTESRSGKQRGVGTFATVEEAVAARAKALKEDAEVLEAAKAAKTAMKVPELDASRGVEEIEHEAHERSVGLSS